MNARKGKLIRWHHVVVLLNALFVLALGTACAVSPTPVVIVATATPVPSTATPTASATPVPPTATSMPTATPRATPTPRAIEEREIGGAPMVYVPEGEFTMGSDDQDIDAILRVCSDCEREWYAGEKPAHTVYLNAFWIDKYEVTNAFYEKCVDAGGCSQPPAKSSATRSSYYGNSQYDNYPVIYVFWKDASAFCAWAGKRLPTEAEWEKAARGTDARIYPWGNTFDKNLLNSTEGGKGDTTAVGSYPSGASPYGAMDMAGNVWEWVADCFSSNYYASSPRNNPKGPSFGWNRVARGGAWDVNQYFIRAAGRGSPLGAFNGLGFRCAY